MMTTRNVDFCDSASQPFRSAWRCAALAVVCSLVGWYGWWLGQVHILEPATRPALQLVRARSVPNELGSVKHRLLRLEVRNPTRRTVHLISVISISPVWINLSQAENFQPGETRFIELWMDGLPRRESHESLVETEMVEIYPFEQGRAVGRQPWRVRVERERVEREKEE